MKKFCIITCGIYMTFAAFGAGENVPTSKAYVDTEIAKKQDKIAANSGATQILMNTGTPGSVGTKNIYDSTASYGTQTESLVTAGDFNTAVQNAIDSEFECVGWNPNDQNDCWFVKIRGMTDKPSGKNLFNLQKSSPLQLYASDGTRAEKISNGYMVTLPKTVPSGTYAFRLIEVGDIQDFMGKTLIVSANVECANGGSYYYLIGVANDTGTTRKSGLGKKTVTVSGDYADPSFTKVVIWLYAITGGNGGTNPSCTYTNIQVEEGDTATAYEPYQNLYLPSGN